MPHVPSGLMGCASAALGWWVGGRSNSNMHVFLHHAVFMCAVTCNAQWNILFPDMNLWGYLILRSFFNGRICFDVGYFIACKIKCVLLRAKKVEKARKSLKMPKAWKGPKPESLKVPRLGFWPANPTRKPKSLARPVPTLVGIQSSVSKSPSFTLGHFSTMRSFGKGLMWFCRIDAFNLKNNDVALRGRALLT